MTRKSRGRSNQSYINTRPAIRTAGKVVKTTYRLADKAVTGTLTWAATEHTGLAKRLALTRYMGGFLAQLAFIVLQLLLSIGIAIVQGIWVYVLIAYGIPYLLTHLFTQ